MTKTRFLDDLPSCPLRDHVQECADEMGVDWPTPVSNERSVLYRGRTIDVWYEESGSVYAWKAFVKGLGTFSGAGDEEAIDGAKAAINADGTS